MVESQIGFTSCALAISGAIVWIAYNAYQESVKPSKYILIAKMLGFVGYEKSYSQKVSMEEQHEALLKIFQLAGYFKLSNVWHDLNSIGGIRNVKRAFDEISSVVKRSKADQADPTQFNAKYMRTNLFKGDGIDLQDALDLILYMAQHAFGRKFGQERCELVSPEWITTHADCYLEAARVLRLIDREHPALHQYDGCWIAGASRAALSQRIIDFNYHIYCQGIKIYGETLILAGERELWANIDGMLPEMSRKLVEVSQKNIDIDTVSFSTSFDDKSAQIEEGKAYMVYLAKLYNIKLNSSKPFIQYKSVDGCPMGRFVNRIYANYDDIGNTPRLTETLLSQDLLRTFSKNNVTTVKVIDTLTQEDMRPNTESTARDAAKRLVKRILAGVFGVKKLFTILLFTNNPSIERQRLVTQQQVNQILEEFGLIATGYQVKVEGVGFSSKGQLAMVHSELGALITEKYKNTVADIEASLAKRPKRDINRLLFQTRDGTTAIQDLSSSKKHPGS